MSTKKKVVISHKKLSTDKMCPRHFSNSLETIAIEDLDTNIPKHATILYKKLPDDMILIAGFENFLTADEVKEKFGEEAGKIYFSYPDSMEKKFNDAGKESIHVGKLSVWDSSFSISFGTNKIVSNEYQTVFVGDIYKKQDFSKLIRRVKKCGELLHGIIEAVNNGEVRKITI